jgi:hypothetical protein
MKITHIGEADWESLGRVGWVEVMQPGQSGVPTSSPSRSG